MVIQVYPIIKEEENDFLASRNCEIGYVVYAVCLLTFYRACTVPPGDLRKETLAKYDNYKYDNVLYKNSVCRTLKFRKLARSKYDKMTGRHVPKFDHFCVWLNQPVGEENHRDFMLFLLCHTAMLIYGSCALVQVVRYVIAKDNLTQVKFFNVQTSETMEATVLVLTKYLSSRYPYVICLGCLCFIMCAVMTGFFLFHLYLCARGMTTNEFFKWQDLRAWHKKATKDYEVAKGQGNAGKRWRRQGKDYAVSADYVDDNDDPSDPDDGGDHDDRDACDAGGGEREVVGDCDGSASSDDANDDTVKGAKALVQDPGPMPINIYNFGIFNNFKDMVWPRCQRMGDSGSNSNGGGGGMYSSKNQGNKSKRKSKSGTKKASKAKRL